MKLTSYNYLDDIFVNLYVLTAMFKTVSKTAKEEEIKEQLRTSLPIFDYIDGIYQISTICDVAATTSYVRGFAWLYSDEKLGEKNKAFNGDETGEYTVRMAGEELYIPNQERFEHKKKEDLVVSINDSVFIQSETIEVYFRLSDFFNWLSQLHVSIDKDIFRAFYHSQLPNSKESILNESVYKLEENQVLSNGRIFDLAKAEKFDIQQQMIDEVMQELRIELIKIIGDSTTLIEVEKKNITSSYNPELFRLLERAIKHHYPNDAKCDPKKEHFINWLEQEAKKLEMPISNNIAKAMFTISARPDHNPKLKRI